MVRNSHSWAIEGIAAIRRSLNVAAGRKQPEEWGKGTVAASLVAEWAWKQITLRLGRQEKVSEGVGIIPFGERHA